MARSTNPLARGHPSSTLRSMGSFLTRALHDGSAWMMLACLFLLFGVVGLYTRAGSGIGAHPYAKDADGGDLGTDMPAEATGREELEPVLWPRRARRRAGGRRPS
jgi:hypothetical protein